MSEIRIVPDELGGSVLYFRQNEWVTQMRLPRYGFDLLDEFYRKAVNEKNVLEFFLEDKAMNFVSLMKVQLKWTENSVIELKIGAPAYLSV